MEIKSIADVITVVAVVSLPIIITYLSKWLKSNRTAGKSCLMYLM